MLHSKQTDELESEMRALERLKHEKGKAAKTFHLKREIVGGKKKAQEATAVKNPENGEILTDPKEIKKTTLKFC